MKELSIEEKAKAYDEALEKANALYKIAEPMSGCNVIIETLFPELKESDDKRIRKAIIELVKQSSEILNKSNQNDMLAWLEKQGRQKSVWHNEDEEPQRDSLILLIMQSGTPIVAKIIEPNHTFNHGERWAYIDDLLEKQGEQKEYTFKSLPRLLDMIEPTSKAKAYCQKLIDTLVKEGYATDAKIVGERLKIMNGEDVPMAIMDEKQRKETTWKPSKEEMDVLYCLAYITNQYDEHKEEVITRLYQDLKREFFNGSSYENMFPTNTSTEDDVRRRSTIQVLEYARSLDSYNQYGKADIDKNIAWLEKQKNCEYIRKDWLEHIKQSWYKEGFIDGKYTPKEWTTNDATTLNELIDFLENGTVKLQHDLTLYANWLKTQFSPNLRILNLTKNKL